MAAKKNETKLEAATRAVNRRKTAMVKLKQGDKPGTVTERRMKKLLKQAQRRQRKLLKAQAKHEKPKGAEAGTEASA